MLTDVVQFGIAMTGAFAAAYYAVIQPEVGGLAGLFSHPNVVPKLSLLPDFSKWDAALAAFIIPVAVQWWSTWYPGSEPGGGGYVAQRMLAARNEKESMLTTLLFNILHYGLRPWPWIIVALASLIIYPDIASIQARFPHLDPSIIRNDLAYPAMLVYLPHGMLGIMVASLAAAYMSTVSTQLNWGASYLVDDFYRRFIRGDQPDRHYVTAARFMTFFLVAVAAVLSLWLENAYQAFQIMLQVGAGTGLIYLLRWFWWRVNAWSEISGMVFSFLVAMYFQFVHTRLGFAPVPATTSLVVGVLITTVGWLAVTFLTPANGNRHAAGLLRPDPSNGRLGTGGTRGPAGARECHRGVPLLVSGMRGGLQRAVRDRSNPLRSHDHGSALRDSGAFRGSMAHQAPAARGSHRVSSKADAIAIQTSAGHPSALCTAHCLLFLSRPYSATALTYGSRSRLAPSPQSCTKPDPSRSARYSRTQAEALPSSSSVSARIVPPGVSGVPPRIASSRPQRLPSAVGWALNSSKSIDWNDDPSTVPVRSGSNPTRLPVESYCATAMSWPSHTTLPPALR